MFPVNFLSPEKIYSPVVTTPAAVCDATGIDSLLAALTPLISIAKDGPFSSGLSLVHVVANSVIIFPQV
jgi:hypothetical protein